MSASVLACAALLGAAVAPPAQAQPAQAPGCGKLVIDVWYDRDQFGQYLKVKFSAPCGPITGARGFVNGFVLCKPAGGRYSENADGPLPVSTPYIGLPGPDRCPSLYAEAYVQYRGVVGGASDADDAWAWDWGNYPA